MSFKLGVSRKRVMKILLKIIHALVDLEIVGSENVPDTGGFVLATSHISRLDTPFLMAATTRKNVIPMVARDYQKAPIFGWLLSKLGVIWISREGYDFHAFREASTFLKNGWIVGLAPEGTRSKTGELMEGKPGAALLALKTKVPVIPAAVLGSAEMLKWFSKFKKMRVKIIFGEPFDLAQPEEAPKEKDRLEMATTEIMSRIALLLPEERRGFYANHPRLKVLLEEKQQKTIVNGANHDSN